MPRGVQVDRGQCDLNRGLQPCRWCLSLVYTLFFRLLLALDFIMTFLSKLVAFAFTMSASAWRIDTHHHAVPPAYLKALEANGGDGTGFPTPDWSVDATLNSLNLAKSAIGEATAHHLLYPFCLHVQVSSL